ncbi:MAG: transglutaminase TgpA family protein, partial [Terriglobales bacterium]
LLPWPLPFLPAFANNRVSVSARSLQSAPLPMTAPQAIERYFNVALYLLVLSGFVLLASTGGLDLLAVTGVGLALLARGYLLLTRRDFHIPESWTTYLTLVYVLVYFADYFFLSGSFLTATIHLVLFLIVMRLFSLQRPRDHYLLAALSFLMVLVSAVLTVGSTFVFAFAGFLLVAVLTFVLMEMRHAVGGEGNSQGATSTAEAVIAEDPQVAGFHRRMAYSLVAIAPALMVLILAGSFFIFFFLPRVSSRYLTAFAPTSDVATGFSDHLQLGRIGQIQQSSAVVMHIQIDNDTQGLYELKWRGVALNEFNGREWSNSFGSRQLPMTGNNVYRIGRLDPPGSFPNPRRLIHYRVLMEPLGTNVFFLAEKPRLLAGNYRPVSIDAGGAIYNLDLEHPINRYEADSVLPEVDADALRLATNILPEGADAYLKLPPLDLRISQLAEQITASAPSNYEKALAIEQYLRTHFGYTLDLGRTHPHDPLANFLFVRKQGHCEYFASSMAVMLRTLGIPSRIVNGFRGGEFNDLTGQYVIRASNAHSWVEAFFPGFGWISFDPTPAASLPTHTGWSRIQLYVDAAASFWREWIINYDAGHQRQLGKEATNNTRHLLDEIRRWIEQQHRALLRAARRTQHGISNFPVRWMGSVLAIAAALILIVNARRLFRALRARNLRANPRRAPREAAALWYERMVARMGRLGWRKSPSQTPTDFVSAIKEPVLRTKVAIFTRHYESARFGQSLDDAEKLPGLFEEIATGENQTSKSLQE